MRRLLLASLALHTACASTQQAVQPEAPVTAVVDAGTPAQAAAAPVPMTPPTRTQVIEEFLHGTKVKDPFRWLEDEKAPEVVAWMKAQDDFTRERLKALPGRDALLKRYHDLYYLDAVSAPIKRAGRYFYTRRHKDKEKAIVYWREGEKGEEKLLLDPNAWSTDNTVSLGTWSPSWDGKKVVFAEKPNAADEATLYVLDVEKGTRSQLDVIPGAKYAGPTWTPDSKSFYYEWLPTDPAIKISERPGYTELRLHQLGKDPKTDAIVHERTGDPKTFLGGGVTRDGKYLFVYVSRGWNENDIYFKRLLPKADKDWTLLIKGVDAKYSVDVWKDVFYVTTDEGAPNKRVFKVDPKKPARADWKVLIAEDKELAVESVTVVGGHLAASGLRKAISEVKVYSLDGKPVRTIELPGIGTASNLIGLEDDDEAYYAFSSFTMPQQIFKSSVKTGKSALWAKVEVPIDPTPYTVSQVFYPSKDGTKISMFLVHRTDVKKDGNNPVLLYGYGGFDISLTSAFTSFIYPWLEAGGIYAVPNLRGGGEYGKAWHDAGKQTFKQNVFDDFAAAAEYLVKEGYTRPAKLAIRGGSNGGLLTGAAMTQRPELFGAVICAVPLLDMVRYHLFGSGKTWVPEYGDPEKAEDFKVLEAYSPYHRVNANAKYPPLLMMSADHDDRVDPMHARKFTAQIQTATRGQSLAWLRIEMHSGHGGSDQVAKALESSADQIAFLFQTLAVTAPASVVLPASAPAAPAPAPIAAPVVPPTAGQK
ncbi:MAG: peptidase [Myxococcaceae bacterium]|nr:peptidase [Myxococcaceae bacterium]